MIVIAPQAESSHGAAWLVVIALLAALTIAALVFALRAWRVEATLEATTSSTAISLAAGVSVAGLSASVAAIFGGPGVFAVHLRGRQLYKRAVAHVSLESALGWVDTLVSAPSSKGGIAKRVLARTDVPALPGLGLRLVAGLRDLSLRGAIVCGASDPAVTGRAAAVLFPLAGVLAPYGVFDVSLDWSGKDRVDGHAELAFRFVPAKIAIETARFARRHFHLRARPSPETSTMVTT